AGWRWNGLILATERPGAKDQLLRGPLPNLSLCHLMEMRFYIWWTPPGTGELRCPRNHLVYSIAIQLGIPSLPKTFRGFTCSWFFPGCRVQVKSAETAFFSPPSISARNVWKLGVLVS